MTLLESIRARQSRKGVITADRYFRSIEGCFGGVCPTKEFRLASPEQWMAALKESESKLCYSHDDTRPVEKSFRKGQDSVNNAVMKFEAVITTTRRDRDGDILLTSGAMVDPHAPLLWQHIPMSPIGSIVRITEHTDDMLKGLFVVLDTELGRDAAVLFEGGALRISHGFDPKEYQPLDKEDEGWLFKQFEIFEVSGVSIPSNVDAVLTAYSREKLHHPAVKQWAKAQYDERPVMLAVPGNPVRGLVYRDSDGNEWVSRETHESALRKHSIEFVTFPAEVRDFQPLDKQQVSAMRLAGANPIPAGKVEEASDKAECACHKGSQGVTVIHEPSDSNSGIIVHEFQETAIADEKRVFDYFVALERVKDWATEGDILDFDNESHRAKYQQAFAYHRGDGREFGDWDFLHHDIIDGKLTVVPKRVRRLIAQVNGAFGGVAESDEDREKIYEHLAAELRYVGEEPPLFKKDAVAVVRPSIQLDAVSEGWRDWVPEGLSEDELANLFEEKTPKQTRDGRVLSEKTENLVKEAIGDLKTALKDDSLPAVVKGLLESAVLRLEGLVGQVQPQRAYNDVERELLAVSAAEELGVLKQTLAKLKHVTELREAAEEADEWSELLEAL